MKKKILENYKKIKDFFIRFNNRFLYGQYNNTYKYINKKSTLKEYIISLLAFYTQEISLHSL